MLGIASAGLNLARLRSLEPMRTTADVRRPSGRVLGKAVYGIHMSEKSPNIKSGDHDRAMVSDVWLEGPGHEHWGGGEFMAPLRRQFKPPL
jgi:hypothetical protein